jgi:sugar/nucleoside kinase (ribokinase family)
MKYDVITIGSAVWDVCISVHDARDLKTKEFAVGHGLCLPMGSKINVDRVVFASGGGATNAAVTFARQDMSVANVSAVGRDSHGQAILEELKGYKVDTKYMVARDGSDTAYSVILVSAGGERTILSYKGQGAHLDEVEIPWDQLSSQWIYINSLGGSAQTLQDAYTWAQVHGVHVATNPGALELELGAGVLAGYWKHADIVGLNQEEVAGLTGVAYDDSEKLIRALHALAPHICIMTNGSKGVLVCDGEYIYEAGIPAWEVVERTGAGDAFHAAFTAEFARSGSIEKAIQLATANSTSVVMQYGAKAGILAKGDMGPWPLVEVRKRRL